MAATSLAVNSVTSILLPGLILEHSVALLTYLPFATEGLAFNTAVIRLEAFSTSLTGVKLILPIGAWIIPVLSTRNSTLPAFTSWTALATSAVTVAVLGFGIRPHGPRILPSLPTERIISGVAIPASKAVQLSD